jgi:uncharacterized protein YciI
VSAPSALESVVVGILRWPEQLPDFTEHDLDALQERHLAYQRDLRERGILLAGGPLGDQPDERMRGLCFYAVGMEEARAAADADPSVLAGRLVVDLMTWSFLPREITFARA